MKRIIRCGMLLGFLATSFLATSVSATSAKIADNSDSAQ